jgi:DNA-binding response OmpR family regulator
MTARRRLLIVDDNSLALSIEALLFRRCGYDVVCAAGANEALAAIRGHQPDVVLLEWALRSGDGVGLAGRMRAAARHHPIAIVVLSALDEPAGVCAAEGFDDYFVKTTPIERIVERFQTLLGPTTIWDDRAAVTG